MDVRLKEPQRFRALLVDADQGRHRFLRSLLEDRGFVVVNSFANVGELQAVPAAAGADLLILYAEIVGGARARTSGWLAKHAEPSPFC